MNNGHLVQLTAARSQRLRWLLGERDPPAPPDPASPPAPVRPPTPSCAGCGHPLRPGERPPYGRECRP